MVCGGGGGGRWSWTKQKRGAVWNKVEWVHVAPGPKWTEAPPIAAYLRRMPQGHYVVTDLGAGVRTWRLRTGNMEPIEGLIRWGKLTPKTLPVDLCSDDMIRMYANEQELPKIIARCLAASYCASRIRTRK